jgi:hypothetical protein
MEEPLWYQASKHEISNDDSQAPVASHTMKLLGREKGLMVGSAVGKVNTLSQALM